MSCNGYRGVPGYAFDCETGCLIGGHPANRSGNRRKFPEPDKPADVEVDDDPPAAA